MTALGFDILADMHAKLVTLNAEQSDENSALRLEIEIRDEEIRAKTVFNEENEKKIATLKKALADAYDQIVLFKGGLNTTKERKEESTGMDSLALKQDFEEKNNALTLKNKELESDCKLKEQLIQDSQKEYRSKLEDKQKSFDSLFQDSCQTKSELNERILNLENAFNTKNRECDLLHDDIRGFRKEVIDLKKELNTKKNECDLLHDKNREFCKDISDLESSLKKKESECDALQEENLDAGNQICMLEESLKESTETILSMQKMLVDELDEMKNHKEELKSMEKEKEGKEKKNDVLSVATILKMVGKDSVRREDKEKDCYFVVETKRPYFGNDEKSFKTEEEAVAYCNKFVECEQFVRDPSMDHPMFDTAKPKKVYFTKMQTK